MTNDGIWIRIVFILALSTMSKPHLRASTTRVGLYERAKLQRAERQRKLEVAEAQLMVACTFLPATTSRSYTSPRTVTTLASSKNTSECGRRPRLSAATNSTAHSDLASDSWTRLTDPLNKTRDHRKRSTSAPRDRPSFLSPAPRAPSQAGRGARSNQKPTRIPRRVDELYNAGVRKMRSRPSSESEERERRECQRLVDQRDECSFRPRLTSSSRPKTNSLTVKELRARRDRKRPKEQRDELLAHHVPFSIPGGKAKASDASAAYGTPARARFQLPKEILVHPDLDTPSPWDSPLPHLRIPDHSSNWESPLRADADEEDKVTEPGASSILLLVSPFIAVTAIHCYCPYSPFTTHVAQV